MNKDFDKLLEALTDRHRKVIRAFRTPHECPLAIAERAGLSVTEANATLQELVDVGLVSCLH